jgi:hypothetical protein
MPTSNGPRADDPYRDCATYLKHGACVCSTGYPATCTADVTTREQEFDHAD